MTARPTDLQCLRRRLTPAACIVVRERASSFIDAQDAVFSGGGGGGGPRDTEVGGHVTQRAAPSAQLAAGRPADDDCGQVRTPADNVVGRPRSREIFALLTSTPLDRERWMLRVVTRRKQ